MGCHQEGQVITVSVVAWQASNGPHVAVCALKSVGPAGGLTSATAPTRQYGGDSVTTVLLSTCPSGVRQGWRERQRLVDGSPILDVDVRHSLELTLAKEYWYTRIIGDSIDSSKIAGGTIACR
jgi:hypothetical protein